MIQSSPRRSTQSLSPSIAMSSTRQYALPTPMLTPSVGLERSATNASTSPICEYIAYYNSARPHQALAQQTPIPRTISTADGSVRCRTVLGGLQNDYYRDAAKLNPPSGCNYLGVRAR